MDMQSTCNDDTSADDAINMGGYLRNTIDPEEKTRDIRKPAHSAPPEAGNNLFRKIFSRSITVVLQTFGIMLDFYP